MLEIIRVCRESNAGRVAGAIAKAIRKRQYADHPDLMVTAIGRDAIFQASIALAMAGEYLRGERPGYQLAVIVRHDSVTMAGNDHGRMAYHIALIPQTPQQ